MTIHYFYYRVNLASIGLLDLVSLTFISIEVVPDSSEWSLTTIKVLVAQLNADCAGQKISVKEPGISKE